MEVVYERCCGLDVHKETVVACVVVPGTGKQPHKEIRTFNTMTADLLALADWLGAQGVTHVALESTGVYWQAPWNVLESSFAFDKPVWPTSMLRYGPPIRGLSMFTSAGRRLGLGAGRRSSLL